MTVQGITVLITLCLVGYSLCQRYMYKLYLWRILNMYQEVNLYFRWLFKEVHVYVAIHWQEVIFTGYWLACIIEQGRRTRLDISI